MESLATYFDSFKDKKVIVLGDVMLDSYIRGDVQRVSPEAPVPIVTFGSREERLGGAANVALNLLALGAYPILCSLIGNDEEGQRLLSEAKNMMVDTSGIVSAEERQTTVKIRVIGNNQQLLRVDKEQTHDIHAAQEDELIKRISDILATEQIDALIFEDYNKGLLTERVIQEVIALCNAKNIPTTVDPKKKNFLAYQNVTLFKPNLKELKEGLDMQFDFKRGEVFENAVELLSQKLNSKYTFVTLSEHGVYIHSDDVCAYVDAHRRSIRDVSGAGDTVIAVATLCLIAEMSPVEIAEISNIAGGLVCEKSGVVSIDLDELKAEVLRLGL
jgi:D-glycero-beta-D-manno-heptose-7-phosphate kinase